MGWGRTDTYYIEGVLIKREKPKSLVQSLATGSMYLVSTKDMQVRCSYATYKPIKDAQGRFFVRFDQSKADWVNASTLKDPTR